MEQEIHNPEDNIFQYIDKLKLLLSAAAWQNMLMDCSKNELFVLLLLYRQSDVNMTQIAEYIGVPLNTATGIVARMEKKDIIMRERSPEDKRIVTISMTAEGKECIQSIMKKFLYYGQLMMESFTAEEIQLIFRTVDKGINVLEMEHHHNQEAEQNVKVRKIQID
jgi:MarR family transcriptional regulator, organic hydroperoxide resistance regulator